MTAITYTGATPTVGADEDTWGTELNVSLGQIAADLSMLNTMPANTIMGRNEGTSGEAERLTATEATAMLNAVAGATQSTGGTKGMVPAASAGDQYKVLTGAGTFQAGYGRAFGCVITNTNVNGSQPTFTNGVNVASLSTLTVAGALTACTITFTNALPNATYAVHGTTTGAPGADTADFSYGAKTTGSVVVYWGNAVGNPTEISVSGFA
jgi:hypothetical protein